MPARRRHGAARIPAAFTFRSEGYSPAFHALSRRSRGALCAAARRSERQDPLAYFPPERPLARPVAPYPPETGSADRSHCAQPARIALWTVPPAFPVGQRLVSGGVLVA